MTIDKAIELLTTMKKVCKGLFPQDEQDAVSLGIEDMQRTLFNRRIHNHPDQALLPGETKE